MRKENGQVKCNNTNYMGIIDWQFQQEHVVCGEIQLALVPKL